MKVTTRSQVARQRRNVFAALLVTMLCLSLPTALFAQSSEPPASVDNLAPAAGSRLHLPTLFGRGKLSDRLGFGAAMPGIGAYPEVATLKAGWYLDWRVQERPARPNMMEYVQTVRVHQKLTCPLASAYAHDRARCPYATPLDYLISPDWSVITAAARTNPGSLWLIGNEMDRRDWIGGGQDEILPETYAAVYHDLYTHIKSFDPYARIAIGGVIQPTPLRLEYLTKVWNAYQTRYGQPMPVDVWNVHNFILKEKLNDYGAGIPPGSTATQGVVYGNDQSHIDMNIFNQQIRAFRTWMKERGQQQKPLIVSEYGVLYKHEGLENPEKVGGFMESTFNYFLNTKDCSLGLASDDCRLVQRWNWYSLDDSSGDFNVFGSLFNAGSKQITGTGVRFRNFSLTNMNQLVLY